MVNIFLNIWKNGLSWLFHRCSIGNGIGTWQSHNLTSFKGSLHTCCIGRFNANHHNIGIEHLCQGRHPCNQTATTDRDKNNINGWKFLNNLHCNGSLTCCHFQVIKWMNKGCSCLISNAICCCTGFIKDIPFKYDLCTISLCSIDFHQWRCSWHTNSCLNLCKL